MSPPARSREERRTTLTELRASIRSLSTAAEAHSRQSLAAAPQASEQALPSGWPAVDQALPNGGLLPGTLLQINAAPGHGALALASSWARQASLQRLATLVIESEASALPHPWVEPEGARAPIWVVIPPTPRDLWPTLDIALRAESFDLIVVTACPSPGSSRPHLASRLRRLLQRHPPRLLTLSPLPLKADVQLDLHLKQLSWTHSPVGKAPLGRSLEARCMLSTSHSPRAPLPHDDERLLTRRVRAPERIADRRASSPARSKQKLP